MKILKPLIVISLVSFISACSKVPVGYEGIKVNKLGSGRGVVETPLSTGRYLLTLNEELFIFPIHTKTTVWEDRNDTNGNESFNISTKDGGKFRIDAGITFNVECVVEKSNREILAAPVWMKHGKFYEGEYKILYSVNKEKCELFKIVYLEILNSVNEEEKFNNCTK